MAITSNTLIGKTSGSIGGVTFSSWKGLNVAKSKPSSVANPNTTGQQEARRKMSFIVALYRQIASIINIGFLQMAVGKSAYNAFASANLTNGAVSDNGTVAALVPASLQVAKGTLTLTPIVSALADVSDQMVTIEYSDTASGDQLATDKAYAVLTDATGNILSNEPSNAQRSGGEIAFDMGSGIVLGQTYHVYLFFYQASSRKVSDSVHASVVAQA